MSLKKPSKVVRDAVVVKSMNAIGAFLVLKVLQKIKPGCTAPKFLHSFVSFQECDVFVRAQASDEMQP